MKLIGLGFVALMWASPAFAERFASLAEVPGGVYFVDLDSATRQADKFGQGDQIPSVDVFIALDPEGSGQEAALGMKVSAYCEASRPMLIQEHVVSYGSDLAVVPDRKTKNQWAADLGVNIEQTIRPRAFYDRQAPSKLIGYLCSGKNPEAAETYASRAEALAAGQRLISASRARPSQQ